MDLGSLHLSTVPDMAAALPGWADYPEHRWITAAAAVVLLIVLPELLQLMPALTGGLSRRRGNIEIEHSLSVARSRNYCARMLFIPFIVVADRYDLLPADYLAPWSEPWLRLAEIAGMVLGFVLLRVILHALIFAAFPPRLDHETGSAVRKGFYNYFIIFTLGVLLTLCVFVFTHSCDEIVRHVIWCEGIVLWCISIWREKQILGANCSGLRTFLYLCGLEFLPVAVLALCVLLL